MIRAVLASILLLRVALRSGRSTACDHPAAPSSVSILAVMVGRLGGWGMPISGSYQVLLQNVFCSLLSLLLFLLPLQWCQLTLWLVPLRESSVCTSLLTSLMGSPSPPPKTHLAVLFSLHKPSIAVASGKSQRQHGPQCSVHLGRCVLFLLYCSPLPWSACYSLNLSCALQLCFSCSLPKICSQCI